jgi:hypothetical protein
VPRQAARLAQPYPFRNLFFVPSARFLDRVGGGDEDAGLSGCLLSRQRKPTP